MPGVIDHRQHDRANHILQILKAALANELSAAQLNSTLVTNIDSFISLLSFKTGCNPESKSTVESGSIQTVDGLITLDKTPDIDETLLLAGELNIDELFAFSLVYASFQKSGDVSAAAAAGLYYEERLAYILCLQTLLHAQVVDTSQSPDVYEVIATFNATLLSKISDDNKTTVLLHRILDLIHAQSSSIVYGTRKNNGSALQLSLPAPAAANATIPPTVTSIPQRNTALHHILDTYGRVVDRACVLEHECTALCQCLLYICCIKQRMLADDIVQLIDTLHHLLLHARAHPTIDVSAQYHRATLVLLSLMLTLLPLETVLESDTEALRSLASSAMLDSKVRWFCDQLQESQYASALKLAWGLVPLCCCQDESLIQRGIDDVTEALSKEAVGFLGIDMLNSPSMTCEDVDVRHVAASVVYQTAMLVREVATEGMSELQKRSLDSKAKEMEEWWPVDSETTMAPRRRVASVGPIALPPSLLFTPTEDTLASLLFAIASSLTIHPALFAASPQTSMLGPFMGDVGSSSDFMDVPSVFLGYLAVLSSLATTEQGAQMIFNQLRRESAPVGASWQRLFALLHEVIRMYEPSSSLDDTSGREQGAQNQQQQGRLSSMALRPADNRGLCAFVDLLE